MEVVAQNTQLEPVLGKNPDKPGVFAKILRTFHVLFKPRSASESCFSALQMTRCGKKETGLPQFPGGCVAALVPLLPAATP